MTRDWVNEDRHIVVTDRPLAPFDLLDRRMVAHANGWTYQELIVFRSEQSAGLIVFRSEQSAGELSSEVWP